MPTRSGSFTLRRDTTNVPVAAYDNVNDLLDLTAWVATGTNQTDRYPVYGVKDATNNYAYPMVQRRVTMSATAFWNNAAVAAGTTSSAVNLQAQQVRIVATSNAATTLTVQHSADGTNWYDGETLSFSAAGSKTLLVEAVGHIRLSTSAAATLTAGYIAVH